MRTAKIGPDLRVNTKILIDLCDLFKLVDLEVD